jgi:hypothetical protein
MRGIPAGDTTPHPVLRTTLSRLTRGEGSKKESPSVHLGTFVL